MATLFRSQNNFPWYFLGLFNLGCSWKANWKRSMQVLCPEWCCKRLKDEFQPLWRLSKRIGHDASLEEKGAKFSQNKKFACFTSQATHLYKMDCETHVHLSKTGLENRVLWRRLWWFYQDLGDFPGRRNRKYRHSFGSFCTKKIGTALEWKVRRIST